MVSFERLVRKEAEEAKTVDLEEFLRSVSPRVGEQPAPAPIALPSEPPRLGLDERLDEALLETFPASDPIAVSLAS